MATLTRRLASILAPEEPPAQDFSPPLLRIENTSPPALSRRILWALLAMMGGLLLWALIGRLDIVAVADGKLVPLSYVKIVQPAEAGIVKEILVKEGQEVAAGQVLMRMDTMVTEADAKALGAERQRKRLTLRRIDAELGGQPFKALHGDAPDLFAEVEAQYRANRASLAAALAEEQSRHEKARRDLDAAEQVRAKLAETLPYYRQQEAAYDKLAKEGFAGPLMAGDKRRERIEKEQELRTQGHVIESARAEMRTSESKLVQLESEYRRRLHVERGEIQASLEKLDQEVAKEQHRRDLMELKAPQAGIVKDLATHTVGTVTQPGSVLLTIVPKDERLRAEVWVPNEDVGFVRPGQTVRVKLAAFPFQKYGMLQGTVEHVGADASDAGSRGEGTQPGGTASLSYKALVALDDGHLTFDGERLPLSAGMRVSAEIHLGDRTVMEYVLSPVQKATQEAGRER
jgi:HlyD family secretion protein